MKGNNVKSIKTIPVIIFILCFLISPAGSEELSNPPENDSTAVITWQDCTREAINNNPDLISAKESVKQSEADKTITSSTLFPQIDSSASGTTTKTGSSTTDSYKYGVTGKQLLFDGFKTSKDVAQASETLKAAQYDYAVISSNIRLDLRAAFVELLRAQQLLSLTESIASRRKQNVELVKLRYEAGREHIGSLLTAEADLAQAEFEVNQAKRNLLLSQRRLTKELGREEMVPIQVQGEFSIKEINRDRPDFENMADNTPLLKEFIAKKESARFGLKSAKADFFPQVYLNASAGKSASDWPPNRDEWSTGLALTFPLFEGGSRIAKVSKAESQLNQAKAEERSGRDSVIFTLEETWKSLQDSIDEVIVKGKFLNAAVERAKISTAQYSLGLISFDDWVIIEDNLVNAQKTFLNTQANALIAEASWIQAKGGTLEYDEE